MPHRPFSFKALASAIATAFLVAMATTEIASQGARPAPALASGQVSIAGTSNIHDYTASTSVVRVTRLELADAVSGDDLWSEVLKPGAVSAFEVTIRAASLSSPKEGLDKNLHKALKVEQHPDIVFRLSRIEEQAGVPHAVGMLKIAGVEREIAFDLKTELRETGLVVKGDVSLLMTDYGIAPPKAMLGMLKTNPKVTVSFETALAVPTT